MALPQKLIDELSKNKVDVPGWSWRIFLFSLTVLIICFAFYVGLNWGYKIYLNSKIRSLNNQLNQIKNEISELNQNQIQINKFYSQIINIKKLFSERKQPSLLFKWIENKIHNDITLNKLDFNFLNNQLSLGGIAKSKEGILEQILIFQKDNNVESIVLKNFSVQSNGVWQFSLDIYLKSSFWNLN